MFHDNEAGSAATANTATSESPIPRYLSADEIGAIFETDLHSGKFTGHEGEWAAYVNGRFVRIGADEEELYQSILRDFGSSNIQIIIQPICEIGTARM